MALAACSVVKPLVCTFSYPIGQITDRLAAGDTDPSDDHEDLPAALVFLAAPLVIPMRFASEAAIGCVGGLLSGFASDLNVITGNVASPARNLTRPFKTNARAPGR